MEDLFDHLKVRFQDKVAGGIFLVLLLLRFEYEMLNGSNMLLAFLEDIVIKRND